MTAKFLCRRVKRRKTARATQLNIADLKGQMPARLPARVEVHRLSCVNSQYGLILRSFRFALWLCPPVHNDVFACPASVAPWLKAMGLRRQIGRRIEAGRSPGLASVQPRHNQPKPLPGSVLVDSFQCIFRARRQMTARPSKPGLQGPTIKINGCFNGVTRAKA